MNSHKRLPRKLGQGPLGNHKAGDMRMRQDISRYGMATGLLRAVAMSFKSCGMPWPGVPP